MTAISGVFGIDTCTSTLHRTGCLKIGGRVFWAPRACLKIWNRVDRGRFANRGQNGNEIGRVDPKLSARLWGGFTRNCVIGLRQRGRGATLPPGHWHGLEMNFGNEGAHHGATRHLSSGLEDLCPFLWAGAFGGAFRGTSPTDFGSLESQSENSGRA